MAASLPHPVDRLTDARLRGLMLRVNTTGFPADLQHLWSVERARYRETLRRIPPAAGTDSALLDLGSSRPWLPFYQVLLGYRNITLNTSYPKSGFVDEGLSIAGAEPADVRVSVFDVERDEFPHADESFDVVLCLEVLEHLALDPMAMMAEVNRVLKPGGTFVLTTPNVIRFANVASILLGGHPCGWSPYNGFDGNRHNREYTPAEIERLFAAAGLTPREVTTFGRKRRRGAIGALSNLLRYSSFPFRLASRPWRNDVILAVGRKTSSRVDRRPKWLYFNMAERANRTAPTIESRAPVPVG